MQPLDAVVLDNMVPTESTVDIRRGYESHATGIGDYVETLMAWEGPSSRVFIAAGNNSFYNVSGSGAVGAAMEAGHTSDRWQHINFTTTAGHFVVAVNGDDAPRTFDGTSWASPSITGSGLTATNLIGLTAHQQRIFYIEKNTMNAWYPAAGSISGALTKLPLGTLAKKGGHLLAVDTWPVDAGDGLDDLIAFITSQGEAIVYAGIDPSSAATWVLKGVYPIGMPIGRRCTLRYGGDLCIITEDGVIPLSAVLREGKANPSMAITDRISGAFKDAARAYRVNYGWQGVFHSRGPFLVFNIPKTEGQDSDQYVMTTRGAWCRFTGWEASCFGIYNGDLYFGTNGTVWKADTGYQDNASTISAEIKTAFSKFGTGLTKRFTSVRPIFTSEATITPAVAICTDFANQAPPDTATFTGTEGPPWDTSPWDTTEWGSPDTVNKKWRSVAGVGQWGALRMKFVTNGFSVALNAIDYQFEVGGYI